MIWVFLAGGTGASLRVALVPLLDARLETVLPSAGTLVVNVLGCLAIGLGAAALPEGSLRPILLGGFLGGFTTYSAFGLLAHTHAQEGEHFPWNGPAGLLAVGLGLWIGKSLAPAQP